MSRFGGSQTVAVAAAVADLPVSLAATCQALAQLLPQLTQQEVDQQQRQQQSRGRAAMTKQGKKAADIPLDPLLLHLFDLASEVGTGNPHWQFLPTPNQGFWVDNIPSVQCLDLCNISSVSTSCHIE